MLGDLRRARYDVALDLQGLLKSAVLARLSGASRVIGFPPDLLRERAARFFYTETAGDVAPHVIDKNLSMLKAVGIRMPEIECPLEDRNPAIANDGRARLGIPEGAPFAIINPGAAWPNKRWPPVYFAEVARGLAERHGLRSLVLWGPGEEQLAQNVVTAANGVAAVAPHTTVADLVSLIKAAALMISGDTGPLHIAAASGTPARRHFRPDGSATQRPVGRGRSRRVAVPRVRLSLSAPVPHLRVVPARHFTARSAGSRRQAAGSAWLRLPSEKRRTKRE